MVENHNHGYYTTERKVCRALDRLQSDRVIAGYFHYRPHTPKDSMGIDIDILLNSNDPTERMPLQVKGNPNECRLHRRKYGTSIPVVNANHTNLIQELYRLILEYKQKRKHHQYYNILSKKDLNTSKSKFKYE